LQTHITIFPGVFYFESTRNCRPDYYHLDTFPGLSQARGMKCLFQSAIGILMFGLIVLPAHATFNSLYVFGDSLSSTTDNSDVGPLYYGQRDSNGRVWIEVLAQRQGLTYDATKNNSYWNHTSAQVVIDAKNFAAPSNVANDLFVVWVCNADTFDASTAATPLTPTQWQATNILSQANHLQIITNLYAKGVRTLILPNAVDLSEIPAFDAGTFAPAIHAGCVDYNARFSNTINQARALCPGLKIYALDFFTLLNNVLTSAANYGLTNALVNGHSIDALSANYLVPKSFPPAATNGFGTNFIFWDPQDPTAEFHEVIADVVQQSISPVQISQITAFTGSNRLDVANMPVGLNGFVDNSTNLTQASWVAVQNITSTNATQSVFVLIPVVTNTSPAFVSADGGGLPEPGGTVVVTALEFYRLHFPYAWNWP
jgi:phospholipase/lecithinase/hemolysin